MKEIVISLSEEDNRWGISRYKPLKWEVTGVFLSKNKKKKKGKMNL